MPLILPKRVMKEHSQVEQKWSLMELNAVKKRSQKACSRVRLRIGHYESSSKGYFKDRLEYLN